MTQVARGRTGETHKLIVCEVRGLLGAETAREPKSRESMGARWSPPKQARVAMVTLPEARRGRTLTDVFV